MEKRPNKENRQEEQRKGYTLRNQFDPNYKGSKPENSSPVLNTVPDMSLTIRELVRNHTRGISVEINQPEPIFFDEEIPRIQDMTDLDALRDALKYKEEQTIALQEKVQQEREKQAKEAYKQSIIDAHRKEESKKHDLAQGQKSVIPT